MSLSVVMSRALDGLDAPEVHVEVQLANGLPSFTLVGLADTEVKESRERVRAALQQSGFAFPHNKRITVNLAPADLPKESARFDLPIALGILAACGQIDAARLAASEAVVVNVDYPLGVAAYNILREITQDRDTLRGVYVLGKAATLNADVGDVLLSNAIFDEHSRTTYWLDNAFGIEDITPYLRFGSGLDNQRAVTVRSTFLQNRGYLDRYYREAYTVVEMEAGPYCNAVYEMTDPDRYPEGEQVNFSKLPIDFGIIHYASDTPYTQARTLGARGLSYHGMDSTYASSIAILRRILRQEGALTNDAGDNGVQEAR